MSSMVKAHPVSQQRKSSLVESVAAGMITRSAMVLTSSLHTREGQSHHVSGMYENTYQLKPDQIPKSCQLREIVQEVLTEHLSGLTYDQSLGVMTKKLAEQMKQRAKELALSRYKYVAMVVLGPVTRTSASLASRCVWNPTYDTFGEFTYTNHSIMATGVLYGLYVE
ncbi:TCTEX1 domain-containing protein 1 [Plakobranchus ocellatus]|uniref:TCTEX1 domain-containing protein 1 n=1 Tax=Plakobranchus ocellatus TaxID=259542 RepID=A0AAV4BJ09_9GAST|nr:TCTEX1 domain-containing protein 1 [Plakobranchus ocellatus]